MSEIGVASGTPASAEQNEGRSQAGESVAATTAPAHDAASQSTDAVAPAAEAGDGAEASPTDAIAMMKAQVRQMEIEAAKLRERGEMLEKTAEEFTDAPGDVDARSVFVNNVDYDATPEEVQKHFSDCGAINRVTILLDKFTGEPKGYAYVEFAEPADVANALALNESVFRGRNLKVVPKRTNTPGMSRGGRGGRGGFRGRPGFRRPFRGRGTYRGGRGDRSSQPYSPY